MIYPLETLLGARRSRVQTLSIRLRDTFPDLKISGFAIRPQAINFSLLWGDALIPCLCLQ